MLSVRQYSFISDYLQQVVLIKINQNYTGQVEMMQAVMVPKHRYFYSNECM